MMFKQRKPLFVNIDGKAINPKNVAYAFKGKNDTGTECINMVMKRPSGYRVYVYNMSMEQIISALNGGAA